MYMYKCNVFLSAFTYIEQQLTFMMSYAWNQLSKLSYSFLSGFVVGLPVYITINDYLFSIARVEGSSMQPTLNPIKMGKSDVVFLDRWHVDYENISRGDIVAITSPYDQNVNFIKRIIGLEGDVVRTPRYKYKFAFVPRGHCWIEGDNSKSSLDSNSFGPISLGLIKGHATHIVWPPSRWKKLEHFVPINRLPTRLDKLNKREKRTVQSNDDEQCIDDDIEVYENG